jgi:hypothetical protein
MIFYKFPYIIQTVQNTSIIGEGVLDMKNKKFCENLEVAIYSIMELLGDENVKFKQNGSKLTIQLPEKKTNHIKGAIGEIVSASFGCKKASKFCKMNYHESKLFLQFKRRSA